MYTSPSDENIETLTYSEKKFNNTPHTENIKSFGYFKKTTTRSSIWGRFRQLNSYCDVQATRMGKWSFEQLFFMAKVNAPQNKYWCTQSFKEIQSYKMLCQWKMRHMKLLSQNNFICPEDFTNYICIQHMINPQTSFIIHLFLNRYNWSIIHTNSINRITLNNVSANLGKQSLIIKVKILKLKKKTACRNCV